MKKLFSKRSGFTLVEVIVAFAIFAIMAAMVMQIIRLAIAQRASNNEFEAELNKDEERYVKSEMDTTYTDSNKSGDLMFDFSGTSGPTLSVGYELKGSTSVAGVNYVVGDVDYDASGTKEPGSIDAGSSSNSGSQSARNDTRITGTRGIDSIYIYDIFEDTAYHTANPDGYRYIFEMSVDGEHMAEEDVRYAQIKMKFMSSEVDDKASKIEYTDKDGKKYTKKVYKAAEVTKMGYVKSGTYTDDKLSSIREGDYEVEMLGDSTARIGTPLAGSGTRFDSAKIIRFYIETKNPISTSTASFGKNAKKVSGTTNTYEYGACPVINDDGTLSTTEYSINIYGAYPYDITYE